MNLEFIKDIVEENLNEENFIVMKSEEGDITFTFENDKRLLNGFEDFEKLGVINKEQHIEIINKINEVAWDKKIDFVNGEFIEVDRYTEDEKNEIIERNKESEKINFYNSEKYIALRIEEDYRLELETVTDSDFKEVKAYIKSLRPDIVSTFKIVDRPKLMFMYETKFY